MMSQTCWALALLAFPTLISGCNRHNQQAKTLREEIQLPQAANPARLAVMSSGVDVFLKADSFAFTTARYTQGWDDWEIEAARADLTEGLTSTSDGYRLYGDATRGMNAMSWLAGEVRPLLRYQRPVEQVRKRSGFEPDAQPRLTVFMEPSVGVHRLLGLMSALPEARTLAIAFGLGTRSGVIQLRHESCGELYSGWPNAPCDTPVIRVLSDKVLLFKTQQTLREPVGPAPKTDACFDKSLGVGAATSIPLLGAATVLRTALHETSDTSCGTIVVEVSDDHPWSTVAPILEEAWDQSPRNVIYLRTVSAVTSAASLPSPL
jgi:hypothetical protein